MEKSKEFINRGKGKFILSRKPLKEAAPGETILAETDEEFALLSGNKNFVEASKLAPRKEAENVALRKENEELKAALKPSVDKIADLEKENAVLKAKLADKPKGQDKK